MKSKSADVLVVGLGAVGSATLYQLAKAGVRVIGIDRFAPPHDRGSSHGETRITRQAIGEGTTYSELVLESHAIWRELEAKTGEELFLACGFLSIHSAIAGAGVHGNADFFGETLRAAEAFGFEHERLTAAECTKRFPQFTLSGEEQIYFEPGGGLVYPERCISALLREAQALGAQIVTNTPVTEIVPDGAGVAVHTPSGTFRADRVVLAAGGWTPAMAGKQLRELQLFRQVLYWFAADDPRVFSSDRCPTFIWSHGQGSDDFFYGFPIVDGLTQGVKVATEQFANSMSKPEAIERVVGTDEIDAMWRNHVDGRLLGVSSQALQTATCFYTQAPDSNFVIGLDRNNERILLVSACSGHGFKHSAGLGLAITKALLASDSLSPIFANDRPNLARA